MRRLALLLLVTLLALPGRAATYEELLTRAKAQDPTLNFTELRLAYTQTEGYSPYEFDSETRDAAVQALKNQDYARAAQLADKLLSDNYLDLEGHLLAHAAAKRQKDEASAKQHEYMLDGLFKAITDSGDGKSTRTAWQVISVREEYIVCQMMEARVLKQSLIQENGHNYDQLTVRREKDSQDRDLFFNVDLPFAWMDKNL